MLTAPLTMREPKLIPERASEPRRRVTANPALPNLIIVKKVGSWPVGAIVPKSALPHGFSGHLELGVVVETDRPTTHGSALATSAAPDEATLEVARLRSVVADYEGRIAALQVALAERDALIARQQSDLAAAEEMIRLQSETREGLEGAGADSGLVALPQTPGDLPKVSAPWKG